MNYVFPELAAYKKSWIPMLVESRKLIELEKTKHLCTTLYFVAQEYTYKIKEPNEKECADIKLYCALVEEIVATIEAAIHVYHTVTYWLSIKHPDIKYDEVGYRLAWIDHIIARCKE